MAAAPEHQREPCPSRIIDDVGGAFAMGAVGGGVWNAFKLMKNSPNGYRMKGFVEGIRVHAPRVGGSFAGWGACYAVADCTLLGLRGKDDPLNSIAAGAFAGGFLQVRSNPLFHIIATYTTCLDFIYVYVHLLYLSSTTHSSVKAPRLPSGPPWSVGSSWPLSRVWALHCREWQRRPTGQRRWRHRPQQPPWTQQQQQEVRLVQLECPSANRSALLSLTSPRLPYFIPRICITAPGSAMMAPGSSAGPSGMDLGGEAPGQSSGGWFGGMFGGGAQQPSSGSSSGVVDLTEDKYAAPVNPFSK